ncbi:IS1096 element passenger TnpR family protein [Wukongibacter sp. M2B1]|uniref:IS1096 element passenger TnpR family protein n=1 Tax=Wukongibacter sp. M2B1 TaxID=3088895 RepID=UPI003D792701
MEVYSIDNQVIKMFLEDFNTFIDYLNSNIVTISKTKKHISPKLLYGINELMYVKQDNITERSTQLSYPRLHFLCNLAVSGKLVKEENIKSNKIALIPTERQQMFNKLNNIEKYIFLLETLWIDCDFEKMQYQTYDWMKIYTVKRIVRYLSGEKANEIIYFNEQFSIGSTILLYFSYFGLIDVKEYKNEEDKSVRSFTPSEIVISDLGLKVFKVIDRERDIEKWNIPFKKQCGEWKIDFNQEFFELFKSLFEKGELEKTLPRGKHELKEGIYTFKVSLNRNTWAKIKMSANHTLNDLHNYIQDAFAFDNDHMYSFFMDGRAWSHDKFTCPMDNEGPYADEVMIGEIGLYKKQRILYLFDFGDEWRFDVEVFDIEDSNIKLLRPQIAERKGEPPEQYPCFW